MKSRLKMTDFGVVFLLALLCCFLWGSATPAIKIGYEVFHINSSDTQSIILFAGIRFLTAGLLVILFQSIIHKQFLKPEKGSFPCILSLSMAQTVIQYLLFYVGLAHTSGVHGTIISGTGGFFSILMASVLFRYEKLTKEKLFGCITGFLGIIIMNLSGDMAEGFFKMSLMGEGFVLFSQISYALSGILVKKFSARYNVVMLSGWQFVLGGIIMIVVGLLTGGRLQLVPEPSAYVLMLYMGMISAVAYSVWGILLKYNPVSRVTIFQFMTPLTGVLLSAIFLGESAQALSLKTLAALILVCLGIFAVNKPGNNK